MGTNGLKPTSWDQVVSAVYAGLKMNGDEPSAGVFHPRDLETYALLGMTLRVSQDDAVFLAAAGTAYAIGEEDLIESGRKARRKREAEKAEEEARSRPRRPKLPSATADSTVPIASPPPLSSG